MRIGVVQFDGLVQKLEGDVEIVERRFGLGVEASELLENLGVVWRRLKNAFVGFFGAREISVLFKHCSDLEPDVCLGQRSRRSIEDVLKALEGLLELALELVYDAESEVDLVGLVEVGVHFQDPHKGLLGVLQRAVSVVEDADAVPQLWHRQVLEVEEGLLVGRVCGLEVVQHEVAVAEKPPCFSVVLIES